MVQVMLMQSFNGLQQPLGCGLQCNFLSYSRRTVKYSTIRCSASSLPDGATQKDAEYMRMSIQLARKALGFTSPNPMVGCVIVKDGNVIGQGFHPKAGEPHAEVFALRDAGPGARGATAYVSLEPCNHYGRTPPCTKALIEASVGKVIVGMLDPNPIVAGKGVETLQKAGIEVIVGVETPACLALNEAYIHRMLEKKPFVTLRFSSSIDGAFLGADSVDCTTGNYYSRLLQENDAIVLSQTALADNPTLLSREPDSKQPLRIILSNTFDLPLDSSVFDTSVAPTLVIVSEAAVLADIERSSKGGGESKEFLMREKGVDVVTVQEINLNSVLDICYQYGFCSVLLDSRGCGNTLGIQALEEKVVQKLVADISPVLSGNSNSSLGFQLDNDIMSLDRVSSKMSGKHVIIEGYLTK